MEASPVKPQRSNSSCIRKHGEKEPPSRETLDKVALLLGFQDWASLRQAMHGESDGDENFE